MLTSTLIHFAILTPLALSSGHDFNANSAVQVAFDTLVGKESIAKSWEPPRQTTYYGPQVSGYYSPVQEVVEEEVKERLVPFESTFGEKYGIGPLNPFSTNRPIGNIPLQPDKEIDALRSRVSGLRSDVTFGERIATASPVMFPKSCFADHWKDKFNFVWHVDEEKTVCLDGIYYPSRGDTKFAGVYSCGFARSCV